MMISRDCGEGVVEEPREILKTYEKFRLPGPHSRHQKASVMTKGA